MMNYFTGFVNYQREFIQGLSLKNETTLTKTKEPFEWNESCQTVFQEQNYVMTTPPMRAFPNNAALFNVDTDASYVATFPALYQLRNEIARPMSNASHTLGCSYVTSCNGGPPILQTFVISKGMLANQQLSSD